MLVKRDSGTDCPPPPTTMFVCLFLVFMLIRLNPCFSDQPGCSQSQPVILQGLDGGGGGNSVGTCGGVGVSCQVGPLATIVSQYNDTVHK